MKKPLISVIIPAYNCEKYLNKCIQSILKQTYKNLEIIIVDDGSQQKTKELCDYLAEQDNRVKVLHTQNGGPGVARNNGLDIANGEFVSFVDSDDWITENYISTLYDLIENYNADISECGCRIVDLKSCKSDTEEIRDVLVFDDYNTIISVMFNTKKIKRKLRNTVWGRMYKAELFDMIRFSEKSIAEDAEISLKLLSSCKCVVKTADANYYYRAYHESITRGRVKSQNFQDIEVKYSNVLFFQEWNYKYANDYIDYEITSMINNFNSLIEQTIIEKTYDKFLIQICETMKMIDDVCVIANKCGLKINPNLKLNINEISVKCDKYLLGKIKNSKIYEMLIKIKVNRLDKKYI